MLAEMDMEREDAQQMVLREAYDRCLVLKRLLACLSLSDSRTELYTKAEQLADAVHHYIVKKD